MPKLIDTPIILTKKEYRPITDKVTPKLSKAALEKLVRLTKLPETEEEEK